MNSAGIEEMIARIAGPVIEAMGLELVDVEFRREPGGWIMRIYIDRDGGVTLDDCTAVSREVGTVIEVEDIVDHPYNLEVSSPGLTRPLKRIADFERFRGRTARIKCFSAIEGKKTFSGRLLGVDGDDVLLMDSDGKSVSIPFDSIAKANLEFEGFKQEG